MLEERWNLLESMRRRSGNPDDPFGNKESVDEIQKHIDSLKFILKKLVEGKVES